MFTSPRTHVLLDGEILLNCFEKGLHYLLTSFCVLCLFFSLSLPYYYDTGVPGLSVSLFLLFLRKKFPQVDLLTFYRVSPVCPRVFDFQELVSLCSLEYSFKK